MNPVLTVIISQPALRKAQLSLLRRACVFAELFLCSDLGLKSAQLPQHPMDWSSRNLQVWWNFFETQCTIAADSTGATGNFAPVLTQEPGQTLRFAPVPFMAVL